MQMFDRQKRVLIHRVAVVKVTHHQRLYPLQFRQQKRQQAQRVHGAQSVGRMRLHQRFLPVPAGWLGQASGDDRALLLLSLANLLAPDCLRLWFQQDDLVREGREAIGEFAAAAFDRDNSVFARNELAVPIAAPPVRQVDAFLPPLPRDKWQWTQVKGTDYKVSAADVRPGDPDLAFRFALTWDNQ